MATLFKSSLKRIAAALLAVAMLAGIMPTGVIPMPEKAAAADAPVQVVYDFKAYPGSTDRPDEMKASSFTIAGGSNWEIVDAFTANRLRSGKLISRNYGFYAQYDPGKTERVDFSLGFNIVVPAAGTYLLTTDGLSTNADQQHDVYVDGQFVGSYSFKAPFEKIGIGEQHVGEVTFAEAGTHSMVIHTSTGKNNYIGSVTLTPVPEKPAKVVYDFKAYVGSEDRPDNFKAHTLSIANGNNWEVNPSLTSSRLRYNSGYALYSRNYGFYGSLAVAGEAVESDIALNLLVPAAGEYSVELSGLGDASGAEFVDVTLNGKKLETMSFNGTGTVSKYLGNIVFESAGVYTLIMHLADVGKGSKYIYAGDLTLTPMETYIYDFKAYPGSTDRPDEMKASSFSIANGSNWEIVDAWTAARLRSGSGTALYSRNYGFYAGYDPANTEAVDFSLGMNILVPAAGTYAMMVDGLGTNVEQSHDVYVNDTKIGTYSFKDPNSQTAIGAQNVGTVTFAAPGKQKLVITTTQGTTNYIGNIILVPVPAKPETVHYDMKAYSGSEDRPDQVSAWNFKIYNGYNWEGVPFKSASRHRANSKNLLMRTNGLQCSFASENTPVESDIVLRVVVPAAGTYDITVDGHGYSDSTEKMGVFVNGTEVGNISFYHNPEAYPMGEKYVGRYTFDKPGAHEITMRAVAAGAGGLNFRPMDMYLRPVDVNSAPVTQRISFRGIDKWNWSGFLGAAKWAGRAKLGNGHKFELVPELSNPDLRTEDKFRNFRVQDLALYISPSYKLPWDTAVQWDTNLKVQIDKAGFYTFSMLYEKTKWQGAVDVYIDNSYIGFADFTAPAPDYTAVSNADTGAMRTVYLTEGVHTVILRNQDPQDPDNTGRRGYAVSEFVFTGVNALPTVSNIDTKLASTTIEEGQSATINPHVVMSNGATYKIKANLMGANTPSMSISYESLNPDIATVTPAGVITAVKPGVAQIKMVANIDGATKEQILPITVPGGDTLGIESLTLTSSASLLYKGDSAALSVSGKMTDGTDLDVSALTSLVYSIASGDAVTIEGNKITAANTGKATLKATATYGTSTKEATIEVEVDASQEKPLVNQSISFRTGDDWNSAGLVTAAKHASIVKIADGYKWEFVPELSNENLRNTEKYGWFRCQGDGLYTSPKQVWNTPILSDTNLKIVIDESGYYTFSMLYQKYKWQGKSDIYIDGTYMGTNDFNAPPPDYTTVTNADTGALRSVYLEKGVHNIIFRIIDPQDPDNTGRRGQIISELKFTGIRALPTLANIDAKLSVSKIAVASTVTLDPHAVMSNGASYNIKPNTTGATTESMTVSYESLTPDFADVNANGVITAKAAGDAQVKITATVDGVTKDVIVPFTVFKQDIIDLKIATTLNKIYRDQTATLSVTANLADGTAATDETFDSVVYSVASGDAVTIEGNVVKPAKTGKATIKVVATVGTVSKEATIEVEVDADNDQPAPTIVYDFKAYNGTDRPDKTKAHTIKIADGSNWETVDALTAPRLRSNASTAMQMRTYGFYAGLEGGDNGINNPPGSDVALNIVVPVKGTYAVTMSEGYASTGGSKRMDLIINNKNVGSYSFYQEVAGTPATKTIGTVTFDAPGTYTLIMRCMEAPNLIMPGIITLSPITEIKLNASTDKLFKGDKTEVSVVATMLDGTVADITNVSDMKITANNDNVTVSGSTVSAAKSGKATVTAAIGGISSSVEFTVDVSQERPLATQVMNFVHGEDWNVGSKFKNGDWIGLVKIADGYGWEFNPDLSNENYKTHNLFRFMGSYGIQASAKYYNDLWNTPVKADANFTVKIDQPGYYQVIHEGAKPGGGEVSVYMDGAYLGHVSYKHPDHKGDYETFFETPLRTIYLGAGNHEFILRIQNPNDPESPSRRDPVPRKITFKELREQPTITSARVEASSTMVAVGATANLTAYTVMSNDASYPVKPNLAGSTALNMSATYQSMTPDIADVNANGVVTAKAAGDAQIKVTVTAEGGSKEVIVPLTVYKPGIESLTVTASATKLYKGDSATLNVSGKLTSGELIVESALDSVVYSVASGDAVTVEGNKITAAKSGTATVKATATYEGDTKEATVIVEVDMSQQRPLVTQIIDFRTTGEWNSAGLVDGTKWAGIVKIADGYKWELVPDLSDELLRDPTKYSNFRCQTIGLSMNPKGYFDQPVKSDANMKIVIDNSGYYTLSMEYYQYKGSGALDIYIDGTYMGYYDFQPPAPDYPTVDNQKTGAFRSMWLDAGVHTLILRWQASGDPESPNRRNIYLEQLTFEEIRELPTLSDIDPKATATRINLEESASFNPYAVMSNGATYKMKANLSGAATESMTYSYENLTPDYIDLSAVGVVTPKAAGKAQVKITATVDGTTKSVIVPIEVYKNEITDMELVSSLKKIYQDQTATLSVNAVLASGDTVSGDGFDSVVYSIVEGDAVTLEGNILKPAKNGKATIKAVATVGGLTKEATIQITVDMDNIHPLMDQYISFRMNDPWNSAGLLTAAKHASLVKIADGYKWEFVPELSNVDLRDAANYGKFRVQANGLYVSPKQVWNKPIESDTNIKFVIDQSGYYTFSMFYNKVKWQGKTDIYIDDVYVGTNDFTAPAPDYKEIVDADTGALRTVYLEAGVHNIIFRIIDPKDPDNGGRRGQIISELVFKEARTLPTLDGVRVEATATKLTPDMTAVLTPYTVMSNGASYNIKPNTGSAVGESMTVAFESLTPDIAAVDANGLVTPKSIGDAQIKVTVTADGTTKDVIVPISIKNQGIDELTLKSSLKKLYKGQTATLSVTGVMASGETIVESDLDSVVYSIVEGDAATLNGNQLTTAKTGEVVVKVTASYGESTKEATVRIQVDAENEAPLVSKYLSFRPGEAWNADEEFVAGDEASLVKIANGYDWEIVPSLSDPRYTNTPGTLRFQGYGLQVSPTAVWDTPIKSDINMKFVIDQAANYTMTFIGTQDTNAGIVSIYVDNNYMGNYDFANGTGWVVGVSSVMRTIPLSEGEHTLIIRLQDRKHPQGIAYRNMYISGIRFDEVRTPVTLESASVVVSSNRISLEQTATLTANAVMSNGAAFPIRPNLANATTESMSLSIESLTPDILKVSADGVVSPLKVGNGQIKVTVKADGSSKDTIVPIEVYEDGIETIELKSSSKKLYKGQQAFLSVEGTLTSGSKFVAADLHEVTYSIASGDAVSIDGNIIKPVKSGKATIKVVAKFYNSVKEATLEVTVDMEGVAPIANQTISFRVGEDWNADGRVVSGQSAWSIKIKDGYKWEAIQDLTSTRLQTHTFRFQGYGIQSSMPGTINIPRDNDMAFKVVIDQSGDYTISMDGSLQASGAYSALYIDDSYIGDYSFYAPTYTEKGEAPMMRTVHLDAGEHTVILRGIKSVRPNGIGSDMFPGAFYFYETRDDVTLDELVVESSMGEAISLEQTNELTAYAKMSNGAYYPIRPNLSDNAPTESMSVSYESLTPGIVAVDANGKVTPKAEGQGKIKITAKVDGATESVEMPIEVYKNALSKVVVTSSARENSLWQGETATLSYVGTMRDGTVIDNADAQVVYSIIEGEAATLSGNVLTPVQNGAVTVKAAVTYQNVTVEGTITIDVDMSTLRPLNYQYISFRYDDEWNFTADGKQIFLSGDTIWDVKLADGFKWEPIMSLSASRLHTPSYARFQGYGIQTSMPAVYNKPIESDLAMKIWVDREGVYTVSMDGSLQYNSGYATIYIDNNYIGEFDFNAPAYVQKSDKIKMRTLHLTPGEHTVIMRLNRPAKGNGRDIYPGAIYLEEERETPAFTGVITKIDETYISTDQTATAVGFTEMSNGAEVPFYNGLAGAVLPSMSVKYESMTPDIAAVDAKTGVITPKKAGIAQIRSIGTIGNETMVGRPASIEIFQNNLESANAYLSESTAYVGKEYTIEANGVMTDGTELGTKKFTITAESSDEGIAEVYDVRGKWYVRINKPGDATLKVTLSYGNNAPQVFEIPVTGVATALEGLDFDPGAVHLRSTSDPVKVTVKGKLNSSDLISLDPAGITYEIEDTSIATVSEDGVITPVRVGITNLNVTAQTADTTVSGKIMVNVSDGKYRRTVYTDEKVANARENIEKYHWAKAMRESAIAAAEPYLKAGAERLWSMVTTQELPRGSGVGFVEDPLLYNCRYCGVDLRANYSAYGWITDPIKYPWKIQCPGCRRRFPSNDFGSFYELGIVEGREYVDEQGNIVKEEGGYWSYEQSLARNAELVASGHPGYLVNIAYPEAEQLFGDANWGVDDGYGYRTGRMLEYHQNTKTQREETHGYIAYYNHFGLYVPNGQNAAAVMKAMQALRDAYLYTGDIKYGRIGAIMIDRIADVYPDMDGSVHWGKEKWNFPNNHGGSQYLGKLVGSIEEGNTVAFEFAKLYDAFFPAFEDPEVISFLSAKADKYHMQNTKDTAAAIRANCEDGILREIFKSCKTAQIEGNFGFQQHVLGSAAVVLDNMPETQEMLDWVMKEGSKKANGDGTYTITGGNLLPTIVNTVDRDGFGDESALGYNSIWVENLVFLADVLYGYDTYPSVDLYKNPKFRKMNTAFIDLMYMRNHSPATGDSGSVVGRNTAIDKSMLVDTWEKMKTVKIAQGIYLMNGDSVKDLHTDIFTKDPERIQQEVQAIIDEHGELPMDTGVMLSGYGYMAMRDGVRMRSPISGNITNTTRVFYIGANHNVTSHAHNDMLMLGIGAFGVNMSPDLGYPQSTGGVGVVGQWDDNTISHNTVVVNEKTQTANQLRGFPKHFDETDKVKVMDMDATHAYAGTADEYRRTVVMIKANEEVSYGVDFFRILGGYDHMYSFHGMSSSVDIEGVDLVEQKDEDGNWVGSYLGADKPYGSSDARGYGWVDHVRRGDNANTRGFTANFKFANYARHLEGDRDLYLKLHMLNDFELSEVSTGYGYAPKTATNRAVDHLDYVFARRTGAMTDDLDTLFSAVIEPYDGEAYIEKVEDANLEVVEGTVGRTDRYRGLKITLVDGRVDYVLYSNNNDLLFDVDNGAFSFRGFVGVYSTVNDVVSLRYVLDGDVIGAETQQDATFTGRVDDFTRELSEENFIRVRLDQTDVDPASLAGRMIVIDNASGLQNAAYKILSAEVEGNIATLNIGDVTLIRSYYNSGNFDDGYLYNIARGQSFEIANSYSSDNAPTNEKAARKYRVASGRTITADASVTSEFGGALTYSSDSLPRGAILNEQTGRITWTPDGTQIGEHGILVKADNGAGFVTVTVKIEVFKSSSGLSGSSDPIGSGITDVNKGDSTDDKGDEEDTTKPSEGEDTGDTGETQGFKDLGGYDWAKDAIENLADKGVVNGTGNNTFSPSKNITRADFALMMVRAFDLKSDSTENFADVPANAYYAEALAIGKAHGIINGVGENKYNPTATITRQDMMTVVSRALKALGYELEAADDETLAAFIDAAEIADYATEHVATMVANGLIKGKTANTIDPKSYTTRAEVAVLIERLMAAFLTEEK